VGTVLAGNPPIKIGREFRPRGQGPHDDVEVRVAYALLHAEALAFFLTGVVLREWRVVALADRYYVMLKGKRKGKFVVAFIHANTWRDAMVCAATTLDTDSATWHEDKHPPKD